MTSTWSRVQIDDRFAELFSPEGARFAILWLHSQAEELASKNTVLTRTLEKHKLACVAPHGGQSWWIDDRRILNCILPWIRDRWRSIGIAGIEMGGQGAIRLGLKHPSIFRSVGSLGGAIDFHELHGNGTPLDEMYDTRERARQDTATLHMHPSEWPPHLWFACSPEDPWFRGNDRLDEKLRAYGVPHTADLESSGNLEAMLQFVVSGLEKESRRLM